VVHDATAEGGAMTGKSGVRQALTSAAVRLFLARGYEETTVDQIAEAAGVARRTFFRYFRTKEDAVFPDHDDCLRRVERFLAEADPTEPPLSVIGAAAGLVLDMYTDDPAASVRRYKLTRQVSVLRDREITAISRYQRVFSDYLNRRSGGRQQTRLVDEVTAAAVVAAHNHVLRQWLREGGTGDPRRELAQALRSVGSALNPWVAGGHTAADEQVVVLMMPRGTPLWRVVQEVESVARH
jgi:AcrR family transcriptional regulator